MIRIVCEYVKEAIHNLKLYYAERMNHCPTPVDDISIDFENREYVEVAGYWSELYVCFVMKNGLAHNSDLSRIGEIDEETKQRLEKYKKAKAILESSE